MTTPSTGPNVSHDTGEQLVRSLGTGAPLRQASGNGAAPEAQRSRIKRAISGLLSPITNPMHRLVALVVSHRALADATQFPTEQLTPSKTLELFIKGGMAPESFFLPVQRFLEAMPISVKYGMAELAIAAYGLKVSLDESKKGGTLDMNEFSNELRSSVRGLFVAGTLFGGYYVWQIFHNLSLFLRPIDLMVLLVLWSDATTNIINNYGSRASNIQSSTGVGNAGH